MSGVIRHPAREAGAGPPVIFLMGPTACGKTDVAVELVRRLPCEIISVDSAMIYRGMDIGTAKPDADLQRRAAHRLIDICDPTEAYSAAQFRSDALREIEDVMAAGRIPLLVGGTMLYFRALERGLSALPSADPEVRRRLEQDVREQGLAALHTRLAVIDPEAALRIHPNDPQRVLRALEVHELTGQSLSRLTAAPPMERFPYRAIKLQITVTDREQLHERIAARFHSMMEAGFLAEVERLYRRRDLHLGLPSMRAVGYRQLWRYCAGEVPLDEAVRQAIVATRQLAKRQLTWLRSDSEVPAFDSADDKLPESVLKYLTAATI